MLSIVFSHICLYHFSVNIPFLLKMSWAIVLLRTQSIFRLLQLLITPEREWHGKNIFCFFLLFVVFKNEAISSHDGGDFVYLLGGYLVIGYSALSFSSPSTHMLLV